MIFRTVCVASARSPWSIGLTSDKGAEEIADIFNSRLGAFLNFAWRCISIMGKIDLAVRDKLGYFSLARSGAELLFQVFADHYERGSFSTRLLHLCLCLFT